MSAAIMFQMKMLHAVKKTQGSHPGQLRRSCSLTKFPQVNIPAVMFILTRGI